MHLSSRGARAWLRGRLSCSWLHPVICLASSPSTEEPAQPWQLIKYVSKKKQRVVGPDGELRQDEAFLRAPPQWSGSAQLDLAAGVVAEELQVDKAWLLQQANRLYALLPDVAEGAVSLKAADFMRIAVDVDTVAERLIFLRTELPDANVSAIVSHNPHLLRLAGPDLAQVVAQVKRSASSVPGWQQLMTTVPQLLEPKAFEVVLSEMQRLFSLPSAEAAVQMLVANPSLVHMCQSLASQARGDRDPEYQADMYNKHNSKS